MALDEELMTIEKELAAGPGDPYRRHLLEEALVVVPGMVMSRDECATAMDGSPGWDEWEIQDPRVTSLSPDTASLTYRWRSQRGDSTYEAVMSSVYVRRDGAWRLALHQQTPRP